jgi:muramoyltetrapeptide carboxypeptidase
LKTCGRKARALRAPFSIFNVQFSIRIAIMLRPPKPLLPGGHVAVLAASSPSELPRIEEGARHLEALGLTVTLAPNIDHVNGYLAGTDEERVETLNQFLRSEEYDAFLFARGGYGAMRILDRVDYEAVARNPRPIIGFSDITALHQAIAVKAGVGSFHGPMVNLDFYNKLSPDIERWFFSMLAGDAPMTHRYDRAQVVVEGKAEGPLFGGCLSLTTALTATPYDFWIDEGIWFWEDVDEPLYRVDRMLTHLRLSGRLQTIRGVIVGKVKGCGSEAELHALLRDFFGSLAIPVVRDIPFGHQGDNLLMPIGPLVRLDTARQAMTILAPAVERR